MPDKKPIDSKFDDVARKKVTRRRHSSSKSTRLPPMRRQSLALIQVPLDVDIEVERTIGGIEMGVLQNGMSYLTPAGLEEAAGAARSTVFELSQEWEAAMNGGVFSRQGRISFFHEYLSENGYTHRHLYIEILREGSTYYACPDIVCMAFLEYFAFETLKNNPRAIENYRSFARFGFQQFVYKALGYTPPDKWKYLHDRISIQNGSAPEGYFIVFSEVSGIVIDLINADLLVSEKTIPVFGVEKSWSDHWTKSYFDDVYGARITAVRNPQLPWAYPDEALAEFRRWFRHEYLTTRFPRYMLTRAELLDPKEGKQIGTLHQQKGIDKPSA
ncbi:MAG TPA: hypothetical protein VJV58_08000 [Bradyrhizobium sp.]|uniref:hypothetical protein n=1 Tax=Bradyrhizobium sp. TaxID=376 RepID=UPI002B4717D1|nr:hypothetical protein [Bradyrhizobium sp.]HKO70857.1 hypothetical protein [Bradyrhizobium sp.]